MPKYSHGNIRLTHKTSSSKIIMEKTCELFDRIINPKLMVRKVNVSLVNLTDYNLRYEQKVYNQCDLFHDNLEKEKQFFLDKKNEEKENNMQKAILNIKNKYGKNAILRGMNYLDGATTKERNEEIGGHHE